MFLTKGIKFDLQLKFISILKSGKLSKELKIACIFNEISNLRLYASLNNAILSFDLLLIIF